jgi:ribose 5-phosphate isomerase
MAFSNSDALVLNTTLNAIPGVVEHGIFANLATAVFIADESVDVIEQRR